MVGEGLVLSYSQKKEDRENEEEKLEEKGQSKLTKI